MQKKINITLNLSGGKKMQSYIKSILLFLRDLPDARRNRFIKRFQTINNFAKVDNSTAKRAGSLLVRIKPSKDLLKFATAIGAGHLNRRWNNTLHKNSKTVKK